jgi:hypothetical protein
VYEPRFIIGKKQTYFGVGIREAKTLLLFQHNKHKQYPTIEIKND